VAARLAANREMVNDSTSAGHITNRIGIDRAKALVALGSSYLVATGHESLAP